MLARLIACCDWTALWEHTQTHTHRQLTGSTPRIMHMSVHSRTHARMHGHTCTRRRYHPSACSIPNEHLHPPGGAAPLSPGSRDLASSPLPAPFMWVRGIISLYVCVCVCVCVCTSDSFRGSFHIGALEAGQPPVCFVCVCVWYISSRSIWNSGAERGQEPAGDRRLRAALSHNVWKSAE